MFLGLGMNSGIANIGVPYRTEKTALLLELPHDGHCPWVIALKEGWVEDLPSTEQVVTFSLIDSSIGSSSQAFGFDELDCSIAKLFLGLLCHFLIEQTI